MAPTFTIYLDDSDLHVFPDGVQLEGYTNAKGQTTPTGHAWLRLADGDNVDEVGLQKGSFLQDEEDRSSQGYNVVSRTFTIDNEAYQNGLDLITSMKVF